MFQKVGKSYLHHLTRVLNTGLDGDGDDVLSLTPAQLGEQAAKCEAHPGKAKADDGHLPSDELDHEELGPDAAHQDEDDKEEGHGLHALDKEGREAGQPAGDGHTDGERDDEHDTVGEDLGVGHHQIRLSNDSFA